MLPKLHKDVSEIFSREVKIKEDASGVESSMKFWDSPVS